MEWHRKWQVSVAHSMATGTERGLGAQTDRDLHLRVPLGNSVKGGVI